MLTSHVLLYGSVWKVLCLRTEGSVERKARNTEQRTCTVYLNCVTDGVECLAFFSSCGPTFQPWILWILMGRRHKRDEAPRF